MPAARWSRDPVSCTASGSWTSVLPPRCSQAPHSFPSRSGWLPRLQPAHLAAAGLCSTLRPLHYSPRLLCPRDLTDEHWSGWPPLSPRGLPDPGIRLASPAAVLAGARGATVPPRPAGRGTAALHTQAAVPPEGLGHLGTPGSKWGAETGAPEGGYTEPGAPGSLRLSMFPIASTFPLGFPERLPSFLLKCKSFAPVLKFPRAPLALLGLGSRCVLSSVVRRPSGLRARHMVLTSLLSETRGSARRTFFRLFLDRRGLGVAPMGFRM